MTTPAKALGIVAGKKFYVAIKAGKDQVHASGSVKEGDIVEISRDDGSSIPYFNVLNADGTVKIRNALLEIHATDLIPLFLEDSGVKFEAATRTIETTVITVDRKLTTAEQVEIAAIIQKGN